MTHGWAGHILRIDLSRGKATKEPLRLDWAEEYILSLIHI